VTRASPIEKALLALTALVLLVLFAALASGRVFRTYRVPTAAMEPTLPAGVHIVVRPTSTATRREIVTFRYPRDEKLIFAKRVVAIGGDLVEIRQKQLFVNGIEVIEPNAHHDDPHTYPANEFLPDAYRLRDQFGPYRVPPDHFFVLGDNRDHSNDSRYWGTVPRQNLIGKVVLGFSWRRGLWRPR
jgi:signal peptidase I